MIRRLQEALATVQAASTTHRLSEQNCVEIVRKLTTQGLLNVIFTLDGKVRHRSTKRSLPVANRPPRYQKGSRPVIRNMSRAPSWRRRLCMRPSGRAVRWLDSNAHVEACLLNWLLVIWVHWLRQAA